MGGPATVPPAAAAGFVPPGQWLGLLGGGQLGRMFCAAAQALGYRVCVIDPDPDSPAGAVADRHLVADYLDAAALRELAERATAVTTEFENVPAGALSFLASRCTVAPPADSVAIAQDRIAEKRFISAAGVAVAPYAGIRCAEDLAAADPALLPGILKSARLGYDGKGQVGVATAQDLRAAWEAIGRVPAVLERRLPLRAEVSAVIARGRDGRIAAFPLAENLHRGGILARSVAPARIAAATAAQAQQAARTIAERLNYVGVLCVEFFVLDDGSLVANEIAPRPHNSGHWSIDACVTSQFEQQVRTLVGLPLGSTDLLCPAVMLNLLGEVWLEQDPPRVPPWDRVLEVPGTRLHLYGKREARRGRKMGHLTVLGADTAAALERSRRVAGILGLPGLPDAAVDG